MQSSLRAVLTTALPLVVTMWTAPGRAQGVFDDQLVQPPVLDTPAKASLAGSLSSLAFGAGDLVQGSFTLPLPLSAPEERGPLQARIAPTYSPDGALTEFGQGWELPARVRRFRALGDVGFDGADLLSSPWGTLARGDDGAYYPAGQGKGIRAVLEPGGDLRAVTADGTEHRFFAADAVAGPAGLFEWRLSQVRDVAGWLTQLVYERNATGRPFLRLVRYGGHDGTPFPYEIELTYELLSDVGASVIRDYRSGNRQDLDRRVRQIRVKTLHAGAHETRVTYTLGYATSALGAAFYLTRFDTTYRSGESAPPIRYGYDVDRELAAQPPATVAGLGPFLEEHGPFALQPREATLIDVDDDGLLDVEHGNAFLLHQTSPGVFVEETLTPAPGADPRCVPPPVPGVPPRTLARMSAAAAPSVVVLSRIGTSITEVVECRRDGAIERVRQFPGVWQLGAATRLTDADRDGRPDLVRVSSTKIDVVSNQPGGWVVQPAQTHPSFAVTAAWLHDMNGDGIADVVAANPSGLGLWYGKGRLAFESTEVRPKFQLLTGGTFTGWSGALSFVDANGDGATDVVVTSGPVARLFVNRGQVGAAPHLFMEVALPAMPGLTKVPLAAELSGTGERELTWVDGAVATALPLTRASTGLMTSADDGKGSAATFAYARADAEPGLRSRPVVVNGVTVTTAGEQAMTHTYTYARPTVHGAGRYLVGFTDVVATGPTGTEAVAFHNDDDYSGLLLAETTTEIADPVEHFSRTSYEEVPYHGLRLLRAVRREEGVSGAGGVDAITATTRTLEYQRGTCPTRTEETTRHGVLTRTTTLADVAGLPGDLHCLTRSEEIVGRHADPARDFHYVAELARDSIGKVTQVTALPPPGGAAAPVVLQELQYDAMHRLERVIVPGEGQITAGYDPITGVLARVVGADGVAHETVQREPVTDLPTVQSVDRGGGIAFRSHFRHDGLERLGARWDDSAGSEASPIESYRYRYATRAGALGQIGSQIRIDAAAARAEITLATAANDSAATLRRIPEGWAIADLHERRRTTLEASDYTRAPLPPALGPEGAVTYADLLAGATELQKTSAVHSGPEGEGGGIVERRTLTTGVVGERRTRRFVEAGDLVAELDDGVSVAHDGRDEGGRILWRVDENGETTSFEYDALGRLVAIALPGGGRQSQVFDEFGRVARIERTDVASLRFGYDGFGRLERTELRSPVGRLERTTTVEYDAIGRVRCENQTLAATGETRAVRYDYDGLIEGEAPLPAQLGRLTQVSAPGFARQILYGADGRVAASILLIDGLGGVEQAYSYYADGTVETETWTTFDADGEVRWVSQRRDEYDGYGRLARVLLDGHELARFDYDRLGRIAAAALADGARITYEYEPLTGALVGYGRVGATGRQDGVRWSWNQRGLVSSQMLVLNGVRMLRSYDYDPRRQLAASLGPAAGAYTYDPAGLPASASDLAGTRTFVRDGTTLEAGDVSYVFDDVGRIVARGDLALAYGPDGELATARSGADTWAYVHDEAGNRIGKAKNGVMVAGYVGGGLITDESYAVPFRLNGKIVGVLADGLYRSLLVEGTGTVLRDGEAAPNVATPFGVRAERPAIAEAIDYIEKGYDADLATIRFGTRDYDPYLGQFLTPDPAMLASMDRCGESSLDCNLYAFARNNPLSFVDPTGLTPEPGEIASALVQGFTGEAQKAWVSITEPIEAAYRGDPGARADLAVQYALQVAANTPPGMLGQAIGELVGKGIEGVATARQTIAEIRDGDYGAMAEKVGKKAFENALEAGAVILAEMGGRAAAKAPGPIRINPYRTPGGRPPEIKSPPRPPRPLADRIRSEFIRAARENPGQAVRGYISPKGEVTINPKADVSYTNFELRRLPDGRFEAISDRGIIHHEQTALDTYFDAINKGGQ